VIFKAGMGNLSRTFRNTTVEMLVADNAGSFSQRDHTSLNGNSLELRSVELIGTSRDFVIIDILIHVHLSTVDSKNLRPPFFCWQWELDLSIQSTRTKQSRVQDIDTIGGSDNLLQGE
jgi:hypothetical protein